MSLLRSTLFQIAFYLWTLGAGILYLPLLVLPRALTAWAGRQWCRGVLFLLRVTVGLRHRVDGRENIPEGPVIYAFKHQSAWETIAICVLIRDPAIILKKELLWIPIFGWYLWKHRMIAIDRKAGSSALRQLVAAAADMLAAGRPPIVFPEGTRTAPGERGTFHPGISALYTRLDVSVVPVALNSGLFWRRRAFVKRPGCITVRFLPPIPPGLDRRTFIARLQDEIEAASRALLPDASAALDRPSMPPEAAAVDNSNNVAVKTVEN